ncbi:hypothetical protein C4B63_63g89 [Trypanosoma cruzi]|uniref:Uncharacterized protein n=1 Tax=Trypanosoma cruzi TaxID=5693 RepID=A0A2V2UXS3_TRYCR|nr:hypothetical protein C4B63_63g89 [Trypanosoma cruzi]
MSKVDFVADQPRPLEDFIAVTGLKFWHAKKCFERFGGYAPALASFAQSYPSLPKNYFDRRQVLRTTKSRINKELELIYRRARWIRNQLGENVERVWAVYYTYPTLSTESRFAALPQKCLRNVRYREPSHFTGPFFEMSTFWERRWGEKRFFFILTKRFLSAVDLPCAKSWNSGYLRRCFIGVLFGMLTLMIWTRRRSV